MCHGTVSVGKCIQLVKMYRLIPNLIIGKWFHTLSVCGPTRILKLDFAPVLTAITRLD